MGSKSQNLHLPSPTKITKVQPKIEVVVQKSSSQKENNLKQRLIEQTLKRNIKKKQYKTINDLKLAFSEYYLFLILVQNYQSLNFTGFRKIFKKHDKLYKTESGAEWRINNVECAHFYTNKLVDSLIAETENLFTKKLENGNRQKAMERLRVPPFDSKVIRMHKFS
jgi:xenotropic and polytropic retrovirus receptor 1